MQREFNIATIHLIVGLGNPGDRYMYTYHNAGALFVAHLRKNQVAASHVALADPSTFMNQSGEGVLRLVRKSGVSHEELLIAHDESDVALGSYKLQFGRGDAGHHGIQSIAASLGTEAFWRLRIGVRSDSSSREKAGDFVLRQLSSSDRRALEDTFSRITQKLFPD
jgi:peptidyl-tRNA hydrolase, PTH1 family